MFGDDEPVKKPAEIRLGEALDLMSVEELKDRIIALEDEIRRCRNSIASKQSSRAAADAVFGGGTNRD